MSDLIQLQSMVFEDEDIIFIEREGERLYPVPKVGEMYGYSRDESLQAFQRNKKFLKGNHYSVKLKEYERAVFVPCLTGEGVLIYTARLGIGKIPEDRQTIQIPVQVRMPESIVNEIDALVNSGEFATRSEFFKRIAIEYLSTRPERLIQWLDDPDVQNKICKIVSSKMIGV